MPDDTHERLSPITESSAPHTPRTPFAPGPSFSEHAHGMRDSPCPPPASHSRPQLQSPHSQHPHHPQHSQQPPHRPAQSPPPSRLPRPLPLPGGSHGSHKPQKSKSLPPPSFRQPPRPASAMNARQSAPVPARVHSPLLRSLSSPKRRPIPLSASPVDTLEFSPPANAHSHTTPPAKARPSSALARPVRDVPLKRAARPLSAQLIRPGILDVLPRRSGEHDEVETGTARRADDGREGVQNPQPRRGSLRFSSILSRIGQDAARRLSKSPTPSPLSLVTMLPDHDAEVVGSSPIRTAIRTSGTFGVRDDGSEHGSVLIFADGHRRRRTSCGSLVEVVGFRALYAENADPRRDEGGESEEDTETQEDKEPPVSKAASPQVSRSSTQISPLSPLSPLAQSPCSTSLPPSTDLLSVSHMLGAHASALLHQADALAQVSDALRQMAHESMDLAGQLAGRTSPPPPLLMRADSLTPRAQKFSTRVTSPPLERLDADTPMPPHRSETPDIVGLGRADAALLAQAERLGRQGWASLHAAEEVWTRAMEHVRRRDGDQEHEQAAFTSRHSGESAKTLDSHSHESSTAVSPSTEACSSFEMIGDGELSPVARKPSFASMLEAGMELFAARLDEPERDLDLDLQTYHFTAHTSLPPTSPGRGFPFPAPPPRAAPASYPPPPTGNGAVPRIDAVRSPIMDEYGAKFTSPRAAPAPPALSSPTPRSVHTPRPPSAFAETEYESGTIGRSGSLLKRRFSRRRSSQPEAEPRRKWFVRWPA